MENTILQLEHDIASFINKDNGATVHFEYHVESFASVTVSAFTINPNNKEVFLLKTVRTQSKELALEEILEYVKNQKGLNSFTVTWAKRPGVPVQTSYFYCHDVTDVVKKFFAKKELSDYVVYEIKLNPIA